MGAGRRLGRLAHMTYYADTVRPELPTGPGIGPGFRGEWRTDMMETSGL